MRLFNFFRSIDEQTFEKGTVDEKKIIPQLQNVLFDDSKTLEEKQKNLIQHIAILEKKLHDKEV